MKVALYARVSTSDRDQNPETQLMALRDFCRTFGWEIVAEYVDVASARDLALRSEWKRLLDDCAGGDSVLWWCSSWIGLSGP